MTTYGYLWVMVIVFPVVAFMLGSLWNEAGHQLKRERDAK